ncbi:ABC-type nitrate/sulfonate/bicarbonate transport system substrate-binding protein [Bradyrhizobium japonicum]|uniref:ABC transporter substrate-binding protein n=1 Tax=Bradyrhizobium elkanii TaxID=29448 RepID=UPI000362AEFE|nr:hypothetical protein [Bradyrhizobium elkanii]MBP2435369.1 ABC-type nitrate/sulfonate/bicarbonate transport system substrate-binding protein [Bradyrhizobium elkanii]MCP1737464.1 ABC-type nitrate/sulfonate/bicarbonate transport system substrate-binding protein [Bradyrhizobium elkanii]MCS3576021.1 ABC-type nitrate/sulfonate/bicarbonate transport system substrate-binding protein [Bradyrhizobium elkanii]MCS3594642.1 ABC-type nitrate/sulfonate/bicarbonate transport system substrate-binding protein
MQITVNWFVEPAISILARASTRSTPARPRIDGIATKSSDEQFVALVSGAADAVVTAMDNVMDWRMRDFGRDLCIIAQVEQTTPLSLIAGADVSEIEDLRGGTLLVDSTKNGFVVAARALLDDAGLPSGSYALKAAGGVRERYQSLLAGEGDATLLGPPFDGTAIAQGARVLSRVNDRYPAFPGQGLVVRRSSDDRVRAGVIAWQAALDHARARALTSRKIAVSHLIEAGMSSPSAEAMIEILPRSLVPDRDGVALLIAQRERARLRGANVTYSDLVDSSLFDSAGYSREPNR